MLKVLALSAVALAVITAPAALAKDKPQKPKHVLKQYDTNGNKEIDGSEKDALLKAFEADKTGPLQQFDLNADGKLDDTEIAAIATAKKKKKDKAAAEPSKTAPAAPAAP